MQFFFALLFISIALFYGMVKQLELDGHPLKVKTKKPFNDENIYGNGKIFHIF
jgi:hypothetical protein